MVVWCDRVVPQRPRILHEVLALTQTPRPLCPQTKSQLRGYFNNNQFLLLLLERRATGALVSSRRVVSSRTITLCQRGRGFLQQWDDSVTKHAVGDERCQSPNSARSCGKCRELPSQSQVVRHAKRRVQELAHGEREDALDLHVAVAVTHAPANTRMQHAKQKSSRQGERCRWCLLPTSMFLTSNVHIKTKIQEERYMCGASNNC